MLNTAFEARYLNKYKIISYVLYIIRILVSSTNNHNNINCIEHSFMEKIAKELGTNGLFWLSVAILNDDSALVKLIQQISQRYFFIISFYGINNQ